jgi:hypothetical protein
MGEPTPRMLCAEAAMEFIEEEVAPMVASLMAQGHLDGHRSTDIILGIEVLRAYTDFMRRNADQLRRLVK